MTEKPTPNGAPKRASAFPTDRQLADWTMRNKGDDFDAKSALTEYQKHEAAHNAATDEFLDNL